jgi:siroheme synthase-like protein
VTGSGTGGYPVSLSLSGRRVVVVGGGRVATRRVEDLLEAGARVEVVAPRLSPTLEAWAEAERLVATRRPFRPADVDGAWLAFAATDDPEANGAVVAATEERRCFVSSATDAAQGSLRPMAVLRRGELEVAVGTGGRSPAVAAWLRRWLEAMIGPEYGVLLELAGEERDRLRAGADGTGQERPDWQAALESGILDAIRAGNLDEARKGLRTCLSSSSG